jgi:hypothetical protein
LPAPPGESKDKEKQTAEDWTDETGRAGWYLYDLATDKITDEPSDIITFIRSRPDTPRHQTFEQQTLSEIRAKVDRHIRNTYMKQVQAPVGVKPALKSWMELSS